VKNFVSLDVRVSLETEFFNGRKVREFNFCLGRISRKLMTRKTRFLNSGMRREC
jgi:hypothetical protein